MEISKLMHTISNRMKTEINSTATDGLTDSQRKFLVYIIFKSEVADVHARDLEKEYNASKATISIVLKQLEKKGLIRSVEDRADARYKVIKPTIKGKEYKDSSSKVLTDIEKRLTSNIPATDLRICQSVLRQMLDNIYAEDEDEQKANKKGDR